MSNLASLFDRYKALVIFDTETSGLNPGDDQIIELAALRVERTQAGALRIAGKMDTFIKLPEGEQLPENIVTLTGITDRLLEAEGVQSGTAVSRNVRRKNGEEQRMKKVKEIERGKTFWAAGIEWMVLDQCRDNTYAISNKTVRFLPPPNPYIGVRPTIFICNEALVYESDEEEKSVGGCPKMTKADKIRSMNNDELARFIYIHTDCNPYSCPAFNLCVVHKNKETCIKTVLEWLDTEVNDDSLR